MQYVLRIASIAALIVFCTWPSPPLSASTMWGATSCCSLSGYKLSAYEIDAATGGVFPQVDIPGDDSRGGVRDFASDPGRNPSVVWSLNNSDLGGYQLLSFDPQQRQLLSNVKLDNALALEGLAIDPLTGLFYASSATALYRLDPATGQATLIGPTLLRVDGALGFDLAGNLFGAHGARISQQPDTLVRVDKFTGSTTAVAAMDVVPADIAVRPEDGVMFGVGFGNNPSGDYNLFTINLATGAATDRGHSLSRPAGLAFTSIPEPVSVLLMLFGTLAASLTNPRALRR